MSRKLDLDDYLSRYQQDQYKRGTKEEPKQSRVKMTAPAAGFRPKSAFAKENVEPQRFYRSRIAINDEIHVDTDFHRSQGECLELLQGIRRRLMDKETQMSVFTETYIRELEESLLVEHSRIRQQLLERLDIVFAESERKVREVIRSQTEPSDFLKIRNRIHALNQKIDHLEHNLNSKGYCNVDSAEYRASIAQIVMSDFESELVDINHLVRNAESAAVELACKLTIDEMRYRKVCQDIAHIICIIDNHQSRPQASRLNMSAQQPLQQLVQQLTQQSPIKQQPQQFDPVQSTLNRGLVKLFDTAPPAIHVQYSPPPPLNSSGSRFFNFN